MSMFFLSNPTLIIKAGINYCIGEGFGTQLQPNPGDGQPNNNGPYPPFPPISSAGLETFKITSGFLNGGSTPSYVGYSDGTVQPAFGTLLSGGGTGGNVLNQFSISYYTLRPNVGLTVELAVTGPAAAPAQNIFTKINFIDANSFAASILSIGAGSLYSSFTFANFSTQVTGNTRRWNWDFSGTVLSAPLTDGNNYTITVM